jgi:hypothetical protein
MIWWFGLVLASRVSQVISWNQNTIYGLISVCMMLVLFLHITHGLSGTQGARREFTKFPHHIVLGFYKCSMTASWVVTKISLMINHVLIGNYVLVAGRTQ